MKVTAEYVHRMQMEDTRSRSSSDSVGKRAARPSLFLGTASHSLSFFSLESWGKSKEGGRQAGRPGRHHKSMLYCSVGYLGGEMERCFCWTYISGLQGSAKMWALGCVNPTSWLSLAAGGVHATHGPPFSRSLYMHLEFPGAPLRCCHFPSGERRKDEIWGSKIY